MSVRRHTTSRVLKALFDTLGDVSGKRFLDVFAGGGRVGEEALRRGASDVIFIEIDPSMAREISRRVGRNRVLKMDYRRAIQKLGLEGRKFDIIFADPPYERGFINELLRLLERVPLLERDGVLILERSRRESYEPGKWSVIKERRYGDTILTYFKEG